MGIDVETEPANMEWGWLLITCVSEDDVDAYIFRYIHIAYK